MLCRHTHTCAWLNEEEVCRSEPLLWAWLTVEYVWRMDLPWSGLTVEYVWRMDLLAWAWRTVEHVWRMDLLPWIWLSVELVWRMDSDKGWGEILRVAQGMRLE